MRNRILILSTIILCLASFGLWKTANAEGIQMLPPIDCPSGTLAGLLGWDSTNPLRCLPGLITQPSGHQWTNTTSPLNLGIGTLSPQTAIDINGEGRFGNAGTACSPAIAGSIRFNQASGSLEGCEGSVWKKLIYDPPATPNIPDCRSSNKALTFDGTNYSCISVSSTGILGGGYVECRGRQCNAYLCMSSWGTGRCSGYSYSCSRGRILWAVNPRYVNQAATFMCVV